jgi:hypothetical protein
MVKQNVAQAKQCGFRMARFHKHLSIVTAFSITPDRLPEQVDFKAPYSANIFLHPVGYYGYK